MEDQAPVFIISLVEPEIPQNTGTIGRLALATGCALELVGELGFDLGEKAVRRAGLDYWKHVDLRRFEDRHAWYKKALEGSRNWFFSKKATKTFWDAKFQRGDRLIFGKETAGLPEKWLEENPEQALVLPQLSPKIRSINLACAVSAVIYEAHRQLR
jgi:tRNA (cytidine/uridine-2'-O-)-methyltransferase